MRVYKRSLFSAVALCAAVTSARGMTIIPTFDSTITSSPNAAAIEAGINAAIARVSGVVSNSVTATITFQTSNTGLGGSSTLHYTGVPYTTYLNLLQTAQTHSANDNTALASLPAGPNNPANGSSTVLMQTTLARTLGYANYTGSDGTISLNTSIMNLSRTGTQNPSFYDLQAVAGHEIDEVLGIGGPGSAMQLSGSYTGQASPTGDVGPLDLFRYSGTGVRSFTMNPAAVSYFSINGGVTDLVHFNQNGAGGADFADWGNGATGTGNTSGNSPAQLQDAYGSPGGVENIGTNEVTALDVIGYNVVAPEPTCLGLLAIAAGGLLSRRRAVKMM
jgi:hypothetical protein